MPLQYRTAWCFRVSELQNPQNALPKRTFARSASAEDAGQRNLPGAPSEAMRTTPELEPCQEEFWG